MKMIARGITRPTGDGRDPKEHGDCDIMLMNIVKGQSMLKANMVYEIIEIMGVLQIREAGPCSIHAQGASWDWEYADVFQQLGGAAMLTQKEFAKFKGQPEKYEKMRGKQR